jgi:hypothetical protein
MCRTAWEGVAVYIHRREGGRKRGDYAMECSSMRVTPPSSPSQQMEEEKGCDRPV